MCRADLEIQNASKTDQERSSRAIAVRTTPAFVLVLFVILALLQASWGGRCIREALLDRWDRCLAAGDCFQTSCHPGISEEKRLVLVDLVLLLGHVHPAARGVVKAEIRGEL